MLVGRYHIGQMRDHQRACMASDDFVFDPVLQRRHRQIQRKRHGKRHRTSGRDAEINPAPRQIDELLHRRRGARQRRANAVLQMAGRRMVRRMLLDRRLQIAHLPICFGTFRTSVEMRAK